MVGVRVTREPRRLFHPFPTFTAKQLLIKASLTETHSTFLFPSKTEEFRKWHISLTKCPWGCFCTAAVHYTHTRRRLRLFQLCHSDLFKAISRFEAGDTFWWLNAFYPLIKDARYMPHDQYIKKKNPLRLDPPLIRQRAARTWCVTAAHCWVIEIDTTSMFSNHTAPRLLSLIIRSESESGFDQRLAL